MAKNLRAKIPKSDTMVINDVNDAATQKFVEEVGNVTIAKSVREVAEQTVRSLYSLQPRLPRIYPFKDDQHCSITDQLGASRS